MHDLLIDGKGYLWGRGLNTIIRWNLKDGTYQEFGTADGLPSFTADKIFLGPSGEAWLYFQDQPLYQFDDGEWVSHLEEGKIPGYKLDATALGPDGTLWICTDEGFSQYDGQEWNLYNVEGGMPEGACEYLTVDRHGNPWMQGAEGAILFDDPDWIAYIVEGIDFDYDDPLGAYTAPDGTVWFVYGGEGLMSFDGKYWQVEDTPPKDFALTSTGKAWMIDDFGGTAPNNLVERKYGIYPQDVTYSGSNPVLLQGWYWNWSFSGQMPVDKIAEMYPGINNDLWLVYDEGLIHEAGRKMELIPIEGMSSATDLKDLEITRTGQIYLAFDDGIYKFANNEIQPLRTESGLIGSSLNDLAVDPNGTLWILSNSGLQSFDGDIWSKPDLPEGNVSKLAQGPEGEIWVYHNPYFSHWDGDSWESYNSKEIEGLPTGYVSNMFVDDAGGLWIAYHDEYTSFDGTNWVTYSLDEENDFGSISKIARDRSGTVYLVTYSDRKYHLRWQDSQDWESQELDSYPAAFISRHPEGQLWLLLKEGDLFTLEAGAIEPIELDNPAPEAIIYDLAFGPDGSVWLATSQGAFRYDNQVWESYTMADGLNEDKVLTIAISPDGAIWFGSTILTRLGPPLP